MNCLMNKFLLAICFVFSVVFYASGATTIKLKSARSVTAEIAETENKQSLRVSVCFIPVSSLDPLNNERMNSVVARFFVEQALSQFYGKEKSVNFAGIKPEIGKNEKQRTTFFYAIPCSAISDAVVKEEQNVNKIAASYSQVSDDDIFLSATEIFSRDLRIAEAFFLREIQAKKDKAALVQNINKAFDALREKIESQDDLLSAEKDEFITKIGKVRNFLLKKIQGGAVASVEDVVSNKNVTALISDYAFHPEFEKILLNDTILLESGGCRAFRLPDGRVALIGVGMAEKKNDSVKDRLKRQKVAEQRAFAALAEHEEVDVTSFSQLSDSATIITVDKKETSRDQRTISTMSSVRAEAYFANMETVGQWYSKDGKCFFLAKGCLIAEKEQGAKK